MVFNKLFGKKETETKINAPEIIGLRLGGAFEIDPLKLRLIEPDLIVEGIAKTQLIQAVGEIQLDQNTTALRFYTDDDGYLQVLMDGGKTENHIADVKLWYFYDTTSVGSEADWNTLLESGISVADKALEGHNFTRVWSGSGDHSPPIAMTEKTYMDDGETNETDQFAMLYEREVKPDMYEYLFISGEEKLIDNHLDRCLVISTGFDIQPSDIEIIG